MALINNAFQSDFMYSGPSSVQVKFAKANIAPSTTDGAIITGVAAKKLRVLLFRVMAGGSATTITFNTKPAGAGTAISETMACGINGGQHGGFSPVGHIETAVAEGLTATTGAGSTVGVGIVYVEVDDQ